MTNPDLTLLARLCRLAWSGQGSARCRDLAARSDLQQVARLAARHRVEAIVWDAAASAGLAVPPGVQSTAIASAASYLTSVQAALNLSDAFRARDVDLLHVKGASLAALAWPRPAVKTSIDVDVLIDPADLAIATDILAGLGYRLLIPTEISSLRSWHATHKESVWIGRGGQQVDLHTALADRSDLLGDIGMASARQPVELAPGRMVETLADPGLYAYLCIHGASSIWFRLKWVADLAAWIDRSNGDIARLHAAVPTPAARRASAVALLLIERLFDTPLPIELTSQLRADKAVVGLVHMAMRELAHRIEPLDRRLGTINIRRAQVLMLPTARQRLSECRRQAIDIAGRRLG